MSERRSQGANSRPRAGSTSEELLDDALRVLQPRSARELTREDARQALYNLNGAFSLLLEWKRAKSARLAGEVNNG